jgi:ribosomal protein S18 acetylase RimI-like enzyme
VKIRRARPEDADAIAAVHVRAWKTAFCGLLPQDYLDALRPEDRLGQWQEALSSSPWPVVLVGEEDGRVTGFVAVAPSGDAGAGDDVGEVQTVYLDPGAWGSGRGAMLLEAGLGELERTGFARATLWVLHSNERARRFYERHGWTADGAVKEHNWVAFTATDVRYGRVLNRPSQESGS